MRREFFSESGLDYTSGIGHYLVGIAWLVWVALAWLVGIVVWLSL